MAKKTDFPEILVYPGRWRVLVNVVLYAAFIFTGLLLVAETNPMPRLIGAGVVVYFGILEIYALWRLAVRAPSLIVSAEGLYDNSSITGVDGIHWHEITHIARKKNYLVRHIALELRDRDTVIDRVPLPRRWLIQMMSFIAQGSVNITPGFLERDLTEVEALLQRYHAEFGAKR